MADLFSVHRTQCKQACHERVQHLHPVPPVLHLYNRQICSQNLTKASVTSAPCMFLTNKRRLLRSGQFAGWLSSEVAPYPIRQESEDRTSLSKA